MADERRCSECGFLGLQNHDMEIIRATRKIRESCEMVYPDRGLTVAQFVCWKNAHKFSHKRPRSGEQGRQFTEAMRGEINSQRDCEQFTDWHEAKSPQEHEAMIELALLRQQQENDRRLREIERQVDLARLDKVEQAIDRRHDQSIEKQDEAIRAQYLSALAPSVIGIAAASGAVSAGVFWLLESLFTWLTG